MSQTLRKLRESNTNLLTNRIDCSRSKNYDFSSLETDEEIKEITLQLVMIRKAYDKILHENSQKRAQIEMMKKQISKLQDTTVTCNEDQSTISTRMMNLQNRLESLRYQLEDEQKGNKTYEHMLARMKSEATGLVVLSSTLHDNLNTFRGHLDNYLHKSRKNKEENAQSMKVLRTLKDELKIESKNKEDLVKRLESTANSKKEATIRRQLRIKKQAEIAEIAANENKNAEEIALKQEITLHKLYYMFLKSKQERIIRESEETEEAFTRIQVATGIYDVQAITEVFLRKQEVTEQLNNSITESRKNLNTLKKKNEKTRYELNNLLLISKESVSPYLRQITELHSSIENEKRILDSSQSENKMMGAMLSQVSHMAENFCKAMGITGDNDLLVNYKKIIEKVHASCEEIKSNKEKYFSQLDAIEKKDILSLFKSLNTTKLSKPNHFHELSARDGLASEEQELITIEDES